MKKIITTITKEITDVLENVNDEEVMILRDKISNANRIFVSGTGRSGLIGKVFSMRLMQCDYSVYVTGETITPSIEKGDLLIIISGSGSTDSLVQFAKKAKNIDVELALVTTNKNSEIGQMTDYIVLLPAATKKKETNEPNTIQPLGSQFDQSVHLLLDALIVDLLKIESVSKNLYLNHANLE